jgi:hypothetical protein
MKEIRVRVPGVAVTNQALSFLWAQLCEIAPVSRVAQLMGHNQLTLWRADCERMQRLFKHYKLPQDITYLSLEEAPQ